MTDATDKNTPPTIIPTAPVMRLSHVTAAAFGTTRKAIEHRIASGVWLDGREYHRAPDGTIWLNVKGVAAWVAAGQASRSAPRASG